MKITGTYNNYLNLTGLLSPLGVKRSGDLIMGVFSQSIGKLEDRMSQKVFSAESEKAVKQLYKEVVELDLMAVRLTPSGLDSVFNDRSSQSSDEQVLTASALDAFSPETGATEASYAISVNHLAQAQKNEGLTLNRAELSVATPGTKAFDITINGLEHHFSIEVSSSDTNEDLLQKMAFAINNGEVGVSAEVAINFGDGKSELEVTSDSTGADSAFIIFDVSGDAVASTGIDSVSQAAQNAAFQVDGEELSSGSNTVHLDNGLVTLGLVGLGEASLSVGPEEDRVKGAITELVFQVNSLIGFLEDKSEYIKDEVSGSLHSYIDDHKGKLGEIGIALGEDGRLMVDDEELTSSLRRDLLGIKDMLGGFDGLSVRLDNFARQIASDSPLNYTKEADQLSHDLVDYVYGSSAGILRQMLEGLVLDRYV